MSEADQKQTEKKPAVPWHGVSTELSSFTAFGVVTLSDLQRVNVQMTNRHGLTAEKMYEDYKEYVKFLDLCAQDHNVSFWDGNKSDGTGKTPPASQSAPKSVNQEAGSPPEPPEPPEPVYEDVGKTETNGHKAPTGEFSCGDLTVKFMQKKPYYEIAGSDPTKFPRFPIRVWPEVLNAAGIKEEDVDPREGYSLIGWTAIYEKNEQNKPTKVIELRKPDFA